MVSYKNTTYKLRILIYERNKDLSPNFIHKIHTYIPI